MKTQCPFCQTRYDIAADVLQPTQGLVRCFRCNRVFNAFDQGNEGMPIRPQRGDRISIPKDVDGALPLKESDSSLLAGDASFTAPADSPGQPGYTTREEPHQGTTDPSLPFEIPDDLEELEAAEDATLDAMDPLAPTRPRRSPWWQKILAILLLLALGAQLAWIRRDLWIHHPMAIQACALLDCQFPEHARPQDFHVIEREMQLVPEPPPTLRLWLRMRNDGPRAQALPRIELTLLDATGAPVARRTFSPETYLPEDWTGPAVALPGEVVTIELRLKDPGTRARNFVIEFL